MSQEGMSVKGAVDQINESLSNAIPELVLLIIALAEKNAPPPPQVPVAVEGVASAAEVLGNVCETMANDEYQEYPAIQKDILDNAAAVARGAQVLRKSASELTKSSDRATSYKNVMDAAKEIAGACITVLQIVYGAFFRRAQQLCDNSKTIVEDSDPCSEANVADPQHLADNVGAACTQASETSGRLRELADNEESPLAKKQLNEAADKIDKAADEFLEAANEYLGDLDDEKKKEEAQKKQKALLKAIEEAELPVNRLKTQLDEQNASMQKAAAVSPNAKVQTARAAVLVDEDSEPVPTVRPSKASLIATQALVADKPMEKKILEEELGVQCDLVDDLVRMAEEHQPQQMVENAKAIIQRHPILVKQAMDSCKGSPEAQKSVQRTATKLSEELPKLIALSKEVIQNPEDKEAKKRLEEQAEKVNKLLKKLQPSAIEEEERERVRRVELEKAKAAEEAERLRQEEAAKVPVAKKSRFETYRANSLPMQKPAACVAANEDMKELLKSILVAAPSEKDQQALADRIADLIALEPHYIRDANNMAACVRDPGSRKSTQQDIADVQTNMPRIIAAAKRLLEATAAKNEPERQVALKELREAVEDVQEAIQDFEADSRAPIVALVQRALKENEKLAGDVKKKDKDAVKKDAVELAESSIGVANCLRDEAARCPDPARKKALSKAAEDLDEALADVLKTAQAVRDGKAETAEIERASKKLKEALEAADRAINPQRRDEKSNVAPSRLLCVARTDPEQQSLARAARAATAVMRNTELSAEMLEKEPDAYRKEAERMANDLEKISEAIKLSPEEQVAADSRKLANDYAALAEAIANKDQDLIEELLLECEDDKQRLVDGIKKVASMCKADDPEDVKRKKALEADAQSLEKVHKQMLCSAKAADKDDSKVAAMRSANAARILLKDMQDNTCEVPDARLAKAEKNIKEHMKALREALARDDAEAARKAAKWLDDDVEELTEAADVISRRDGAIDPAKAARLQQLVSDVDGQSSELRKAAKEWERAHKAKDTAAEAEAKKKVAKKVDDLEKEVAELNKALDEPYRTALVDEEKALRKLLNAATIQHDPEETLLAARELVEEHKKLCAVAKPANADRVMQQQALASLEKLIPAAVEASKVCVATPCEEQDKKLQAIVYEMQTELQAVKAGGEKGTEKGEAAAALVAIRRDLANIKRAAEAGDKAALTAAKKSLANHVAQLEEIARKPQCALRNPNSADVCEVEEALQQIRKFTAEMDQTLSADAIAASASYLMGPLELLEANVEAPRSEAADTKKRVAGLAVKARKGAVNVNKRNMDDLLSAGRNLADAMKGFGDSARSAAAEGPGTKRSNAALALDDMLRNMEMGLTVDMSKMQDLMKDASANEPKKAAAPEPAGKPTFASSIAKVASQIESAADAHKSDNATPMSSFLKQLSEAARQNQRQDMLVSARGVSACVMTFCKDLTTCAKNCKDAVYQDKMYNAVAAMKNFGTQLKILTAVKAASSVDDSDSDDQIINVVQLLGRTTVDALAAIEITNKGNLLRKK